MELFGSNIKKILIFSQKNKAFLIFLEMEPCPFQPKQKTPQKLAKTFYIVSKESFSYISRNRNSKKASYISGVT